MPEKRPERAQATLKQVRRSKAIGISVLVGVIAAICSALVVVAIDRPHRAPIGAWISEFVKSPGFAGVSAVMAASLALWGIFTQVAVAKRSLDHQREVDEHRAWWGRFEWTAARAVPRSKDEVPLPYNALLSTLTGLTETAADDVQQRAVGAITEAAARTEQQSQQNGHSSAERSHGISEQTLDALRKYTEAAGNSPAHSASVDAHLYQLQVIQALRRILPPESVTTEALYKEGSNLRAVRPDAVVDYKGKRIIVEVKSFRTHQSLPTGARNQMLNMVRATGAHAAVLVTPVELRTNLLDSDTDMIAAVWASSHDDGHLLAALERVAT